ncbi:hypothetical protein HY745_10760, partial [Candidatus Desantisbacteria bacterium]|nr:hypothetical protein [Candidatus Desantisbacteria bacterium]
CFAQESKSKTAAPAPAGKEKAKKKEGKKKDEGLSLTGKVQLVTLADTTNGTKTEIIVLDEKNKEHNFLVKSTTTIYDVNFKATTLGKINKDEKVKVKYIITKEGVNEAASINLVK